MAFEGVLGPRDRAIQNPQVARHAGAKGTAQKYQAIVDESGALACSITPTPKNTSERKVPPIASTQPTRRERHASATVRALTRANST